MLDLQVALVRPVGRCSSGPEVSHGLRSAECRSGTLRVPSRVKRATGAHAPVQHAVGCAPLLVTPLRKEHPCPLCFSPRPFLQLALFCHSVAAIAVCSSRCFFACQSSSLALLSLGSSLPLFFPTGPLFGTSRFLSPKPWRSARKVTEMCASREVCIILCC